MDTFEGQEERRKSALTHADFETLRTQLPEWLLEDTRWLDLIADAVEKKLWEGWYQQIGEITLRATGYVAGAALVALAGWLAVLGKLIP